MEPQHQHPATVDPDLAPRQRIVQAAILLIAEHGFSGVSMTTLAKAAGVSRQTVYNNFADVDSVVAAAVNDHNAEALKQLDTSLRLCPTAVDQLVHFARHFADLGAHGHGQQFEHGLSAGTRTQLAAYEEAIDDRIRSTLLDGVASGEFRTDVDPATDPVLIHGLLKGAQAAAFQRPDEAALIAQTAARTALKALARQESRSGD
ncbi:MAG: TetR/AcrR family transcriptional regulator [Actinobacteria bacterium]|nr:TetR/AcrR family transcriptional regulator [Actinomycetota bacterium]MCB9411517.1 TetR/AcrR family transcriptional regulator [Actinomycetota bacterium]